MVLPCSCIRAKNNVSSFVFSNDTDVNTIDHTYLDEVHRNSFSSGSLYTLDHTIITNQSVHCLFGGVQLSNKIGSLVPPTQSVIVNDSIMTAITNDVKCTIPSTLLFIQHATNMSELTYGDLKKLMSNWSKPNDMRDYMLAWTKMYKAECYRISYTIMKDLIQEMETIEYNQKESSVCSRKQRRLRLSQERLQPPSCRPPPSPRQTNASTLLCKVAPPPPTRHSVFPRPHPAAHSPRSARSPPARE